MDAQIVVSWCRSDGEGMPVNIFSYEHKWEKYKESDMQIGNILQIRTYVWLPFKGWHIGTLDE